ncbi:MAG: DUF5329 domain-containing protein, partial [Desulfobacterota bacterium]|nr:DUF5329 domain-containing protein [Thermodesulfobacteriota bacterium]
RLILIVGRQGNTIMPGRQRRRLFIIAGSVTLLLLSGHPALAQPSTLPQEEQQRIEALIHAVEQLGDAAFIRNGRAYDAAAAARFLREKWKARASEVRSAEDFIEKVASFSSTTGKPYLIRFRDGRELSSAKFLRGQLARTREKQ